MAVTAEKGLTFPKLLVENAKKFGNRKVAMREKDLGIWQPYTWAQYLENVKSFAAGLAELGFKRGDRLAIIGDNRPQLYWAQIAAQALGGIPVPLYQDSIEQEIQYVVEHSEAKIAVAEDQEQVDKLMGLKKRLPALEVIVYKDPRGLYEYKEPFLKSFVEVEKLGEKFEGTNPGYFQAQVEEGKPDDLALICYTSGTTGTPKGVMLSHANLMASVNSFLQVEGIRSSDEIMAYLPMAWIGDFYFSVALSFATGMTVNCPEDPASIMKDMREIGPSFILCPPRVWEAILAEVQLKIEDSDRVKRKVFNYFMEVGQKVTDRWLEKKSVGPGLGFLYTLGRLFTYTPLKDQLGMRRARIAYTGGAALGPEVFKFYRSLGLNYKQLYGLTEVSAIATHQPDAEATPETVGKPLPGVEISLSQSGEVLLKAAGVFAGYYKNPEATAEALKDGWLHTGDAGFIGEDGHLKIIDRVKDVSALSDGTIFAPQYIENKLKFSPYIKEAIAIGKDRPYVTAIINIDAGNTGNWVERNKISYTSYMELAQKQEVYDLIRGEISTVNKNLASDTQTRKTQIKKFLILHKELDPDDAEITRTRKLRRGFISEKYADIIEAFYTDKDQVRVTANITYEDGRKASAESSLRICDVAEEASLTART